MASLEESHPVSLYARSFNHPGLAFVATQHMVQSHLLGFPHYEVAAPDARALLAGHWSGWPVHHCVAIKPTNTYLPYLSQSPRPSQHDARSLVLRSGSACSVREDSRLYRSRCATVGNLDIFQAGPVMEVIISC